MTEQTQLNLPSKFVDILTAIQGDLPEEQALVAFTEMADVLEKVVKLCEFLHCTPLQVFEELRETYAEITDMAMRGNAICEVKIIGKDEVAVVGHAKVPPMLVTTHSAAQKRNALHLVVANSQPQPEPAS